MGLACLASAGLAQRQVGEVKVPVVGGTATVLIEDASPNDLDAATGTNVRPYGVMPWGVMLSVSASGRQLASSPARGWTAPNASLIVDHVATVDTDGSLIAFYWAPDDTRRAGRTSLAGWKAVDVTEKTGVVVAVEQPASWQVQDGQDLRENLAARDRSGNLRLFSWRPGRDWRAEPIHPAGSRRFEGLVTAWVGASGSLWVENVAARSDTDDLVVFRRQQGSSSWSATALTGRKITGDPEGWLDRRNGGNRIAAIDSAQHLLLYSSSGTSPWAVQDLTQLVGGQLVKGRATTWQKGGAQYLAIASPKDDLLVFREDPIEGQWSVENVTRLTGFSIAAAPTYWQSSSFGEQVTNLAAPDNQQRVRIFSHTTSRPWSTADITTPTGISVRAPLTAWTTPWGNTLIEHLAAPTPDARLHVFSREPDKNWTAIDVTTRSSGRVVYSSTPFAGVWKSSDYGITWTQSTRPQPPLAANEVSQSLEVPTVLDVVVSPADPMLVFAAADREGRSPSKAGLYRSTDGGDHWARVFTFDCDGISQPVSQVVFAPDDPRRVYAAGGCGIARSVDGGNRWELLSPPETPAGIRPGNRRVWHLAVSRQQGRTAKDRVLAACGDGSVWLSRRDGERNSWIRDHGTGNLPPSFCAKTGYQTTDHGAAQMLALDPGQPDVVYLAHPNRANGPSYYHPTSLGPQGVPCNVPLVYDVNGDAQLDMGDMFVRVLRQPPAAGTALTHNRSLKFVDTDGSGAWNLLPRGVPEPIYYDTNGDGVVDAGDAQVTTASANGTTLTTDRRIRHPPVRYGGFQIGFGVRPCGEGSLWLGDLSRLGSGRPSGEWSQLPGPPVYWGNTGSGAVAVATKETASGHLLFFADQDTLNVSVGRPSAGGWFRLAGLNASEANRLGIDYERIYVHQDPHGIIWTPDFDLELKASNQPAPYQMQSELASCVGGRLWASTDGGVFSNADCGEFDEENRNKLWHPAESGLNTLWAVNVAGATGGRQTAFIERGLYFGTAHDDDFSSVTDGRKWHNARWQCGDCDSWYGDLHQPERVVKVDPRFDRFAIFSSGQRGVPPDASSNSVTIDAIPYPPGSVGFAASARTILGLRPTIQSLPTETPPAKGDLLTISQTNSGRILMRAHDSVDATATNSGFQQVGPMLPATVDRVQAAGGHASPSYFVGDGTGIWRLDTNAAGGTIWNQIVPGTGATTAARFFVDPWDEQTVYLMDGGGVRLSTDGGNSWRVDRGLARAVSANGSWPFACRGHLCPLNDMAFDPGNRQRRFAAGVAGVFWTADGKNWFRLLDTRAIPSRPLGLWFDPLTDPNDLTLFVANMGRSILRIHPIPESGPAILERPSGPSWNRTTAVDWHRIEDLVDDPATWDLRGLAEWVDQPGPKGLVLTLGALDNTTATARRRLYVPCDGNAYRLSGQWSVSTRERNEGGDVLSLVLHREEEQQRVTLARFTTAYTAHEQWQSFAVDPGQLGCGPGILNVEATSGAELPSTFFLGDLFLEVADPE